ncbi:hypothetical protein [Haloferula sp. BvORR071]|uniref:hypothetical protein n=1 Tax=Haloferula sp. BvORR071 TaxID=1396141 RepID=UPI00055462B1|nr:hypothetical protein [Haloferula sp. BvORR071]
MDPDELKRRFGEEYPAALTFEGKRLPLKGESLFGRTYVEEGTEKFFTISRFMDGSATISLEELEAEWPAWSDRLRGSFCMGLGWLRDQADFRGMLQYIMDHGGEDERGAIANIVASALPQDQAFDFLVTALRNHQGPGSANLIQGIAATEHPHASGILREHLAYLWQMPDLWKEDPFMNWTAFDASCCILHLLEAGGVPGDYEEQVRCLASHACEGNRRSTKSYLGAYYPWLE